ncbi:MULTISPECIES: DUF421 domain-containing protein [Cytobacillus]|jgi:uncharacterized membrane protein YcaP (DUF421 family)|uniref:YetF C-terminal domain-containing protein n=1 Tax=Cytobacillus oceanisediminis 2691 TaxID=1196031 RepID=A0A160M707_9BACI|nr:MULTISPECIES: DUF421 domain-containing protein [Cytobacillus]MBY0158137.1 DUF421 domain-containing protein [Cytobacillus firmus]AND37973.1 hypothetical protein A361_02035 [Cytobacillus oceanisediminis 2691]MBU8732776.1 DUF421 domain-containing protein [Cytobacillus oceanisediminis]MCM3245468.1 DUF421 domain-containing protein [Cytobacillus oceanisediminis]MCM3394759.1 DUF421 domain-containing protein [Cytobacillus oceanisediminis]
MFLILKILSLYLITIMIMRLMGKSTIIQMTPYDLVAIIIVGTVASEPLISTEYWPTLAALAILVGLHILFSYLTLNQIGNRFFLGEPTMLIKNGEILEDNLEKSHLSMTQLLSILRSKGYPKIADVDYAILEPIGEVSIIPKVANTPVTVEHLNISIQDEGLPIAVIVDGRIQARNLELLGQTKDWLLEQLRQNNLNEKDIMYAYVNEKSKKLNINRRR